jgi:hypothetical protein
MKWRVSRKYKKKLFREEVEDLTGRLRTDPDEEELRSVLKRKGLDPASVLLVSCLQDGDDHEWGVVVTPERRVIEYERRVRLPAPRKRARLLRWEDKTGDAKFRRFCPAVTVALEMLNS